MREMKDSGIAWIGEIPKDWEVYRIKYNTFLKGRIGWQGLNSNDFLDEGYCLITGTDFDNKGGINWNTCYRISKEKFDEDELLHIKNGDLLMTKDGTVGKMAYIQNLPEDASLNSHLLIIRQITSNMSNRYLYWAMLSDVFKGFCSFYESGTIMSSISQTTLGNYSCPCPPLPEQQSIANFLDEKCGEIDELVALQEKMIDELKAYKQSVITETVTKGLDPNVKMKDSGVDWIGNIPEDWSSQRLKFLCTIATGNKDTQDSEDTGIYPFYVRSPKIEHSNSWTFDGEGILMAGDGAGAGRVFHHAFGKYAVHQRVYRLADFAEIDTSYLFFYLSSLFCKVMDMGSAQSTVPSVRLPMLQNFFVCLPPLSEQHSIATYLDEKCSEIDSLIAIKQKKIEELKDYKKSLIYEYVTGKKQVE